MTTPPHTHLFAVASGPCTVTPSCFRSPNYPSEYANDQACTIHVLWENVVLSVAAFRTESRYDAMVVNGVAYSGAYGPQGEAVKLGTGISCSSDESVVAAGFEICAGSAP